MLYHCKDPEKHSVLLLKPTEMSAINIGRTNNYSGLGLHVETKVIVEMTDVKNQEIGYERWNL